MNIRFTMAGCAAALFLTAAPCLAGPCSKQIAETEAAFDAKLHAAAANGPTAPESTGATLHHQPTPGTIARAEAQLGDISAENAQAVGIALDKAHAADDIGDVEACKQALADARVALNQ